MEQKFEVDTDTKKSDALQADSLETADSESARAELTGLDPAELEICLKVLSEAAELDDEHPDSITMQRAVGHLFKRLKKKRRLASRAAVNEADRQWSLRLPPVHPIASTTRPQAFRSSRTPPAPPPARSSRRGRATSASSATPQSTPFYHQLCPRMRCHQPQQT